MTVVFLDCEKTSSGKWQVDNFSYDPNDVWEYLFEESS